jgi:hypothetical protein
MVRIRFPPAVSQQRTVRAVGFDGSNLTAYRPDSLLVTEHRVPQGEQELVRRSLYGLPSGFGSSR